MRCRCVKTHVTVCCACASLCSDVTQHHALHALEALCHAPSARALGVVRQRQLLQSVGTFCCPSSLATPQPCQSKINRISLMSIQVLDRLNALFEPGGELVISERGLDSSGPFHLCRHYHNLHLSRVQTHRFVPPAQCPHAVFQVKYAPFVPTPTFAPLWP